MLPQGRIKGGRQKGRGAAHRMEDTRGGGVTVTQPYPQ